jgi:uncharacterized protein (TIGR00269 family)
MASCSKCEDEAALRVPYSGQRLCGGHHRRFVEKRVKREVRDQFTLPPDGATIAVGLSGGKDSTVATVLLDEIFGENPKVSVEAVAVDEGIEGYRAESLEMAEELCRERGIPLHVTAYEDVAGVDQDTLARESDGPACRVCGVLRRRALNALAREVGADWLATGHNLDDVAQTILMSFLRADLEGLARLAPHEEAPEGLVPRIQPLRAVPEREVALYAHLRGFGVPVDECPHSALATRRYYRDLLHDLEERTPGTRHRLVAAHDELRGPLQEQAAESDLEGCESCGEPTSGGVCRACSLLQDLAEEDREGDGPPVELGPPAGEPETVVPGDRG